LFAGTVFIEQATELDTYLSIGGILLVAALFTITGNYGYMYLYTNTITGNYGYMYLYTNTITGNKWLHVSLY